MHLFGIIISFIFIISSVKCFTPNCIFENQFRFYRFPVQGCSETFQDKCRFHPAGYFKALGDATIVKIGETEVLPTCAFYNVDGLKHIYGVNSQIKVIATGAFIDLKLENISLAFNWITELRQGIFENVSVELLDLSWNKIVYVDTYAFSGIHDLKYLNMSKNAILTLSINSLPMSLSSVDLGHNLLSRVAINSNKFTNLTFINLRSNLIEKIALSITYPITEIDFTDNRLKGFDFMEVSFVKMFRMGMNMFEDVPLYLEGLNAKEIDIHPNPWKCEQLTLLWESLITFNINLAPKERNENPSAECFTGGGTLGLTRTRSTPCSDDHECPDNMICRTKKCWNPCDNGACHRRSHCWTANHQFRCSCHSSLHMNPLDLSGECHDVQCFTSADCYFGGKCLYNECYKEENLISPTTEIYHFLPPPTTADYDGEVSPSAPWWFEDIPKVIPDIKPRINHIMAN